MMTNRFVHSSKYLFDYPDYQLQTQNRNGHDNGCLGLWVTRPDHFSCRRYGRYLYELTVDSCSRFIDLDLREVCKHLDYLLDLRHRLSNEFDIINLIEGDGQIVQSIIMNYEVIESFKLVTTCQSSNL